MSFLTREHIGEDGLGSSGDNPPSPAPSTRGSRAGECAPHTAPCVLSWEGVRLEAGRRPRGPQDTDQNFVSVTFAQVCCYPQPKASPTDVSLLAWLLTLPSCPTFSSLLGSPSAHPVDNSVLAVCAPWVCGCSFRPQIPVGTFSVPGCPHGAATPLQETEKKHGEQIKHRVAASACSERNAWRTRMLRRVWSLLGPWQ